MSSSWWLDTWNTTIWFIYRWGPVDLALEADGSGGFIGKSLTLKPARGFAELPAIPQ